MCGGYYEEELSVKEVKWYARGEMGEAMLNLIERMIDGGPNEYAYCIGRMKELGLSIDEIEQLMDEEALI